jgi:hypothetical protein
VLIDHVLHPVPMIGFFIIVALLVIGPLAVVAGTDSRIDEVGRRRFGR